MSSSPQVAPSLRAERLTLDQVPVVDFRPFLEGDPAQRKRAAWSWPAPSAIWGSPTWPATGSTRP
jgi:hypothetical protein